MAESQISNPEAESAETREEQHREEDRILRKRQRKRSIALAWGLVALATLFFIVTIVRLGPMVGNRPL